MARPQPTGVRLGGVVIGSDDPRRLSEWYRAALFPAGPPGPVLELPTGRLIFDRRDDLAAGALEPGRILLNFYVDDIRAAAARLDRLEVEWIRRVERFGPGQIGTVTDPDGNYVQVVQLDAGP